MIEYIPAPIAKISPDGNLTPRQKRRLLLDIALRRIKPGTGSSHEFMMRRTAMHQWPDLREILHDIDWVIVGGVATRAYMPERFTNDMDILIKSEDQQRVLILLQEAGYMLGPDLSIPGCVVISPDGVEIDVLFGEQTWLDGALRQPYSDPAGYPVLALPYLVLLKLTVSRSQDVADVSRMLGWADETELNKVRDVINRYNPEDSEDLEALIFLGQQERKTIE